jgi:hypothetical protein
MYVEFITYPRVFIHFVCLPVSISIPKVVSKEKTPLPEGWQLHFINEVGRQTQGNLGVGGKKMHQ